MRIAISRTAPWVVRIDGRVVAHCRSRGYAVFYAAAIASRNGIHPSAIAVEGPPPPLCLYWGCRQPATHGIHYGLRFCNDHWPAAEKILSSKPRTSPHLHRSYAGISPAKK